MIRKLKGSYQEAGFTINTNKSEYIIIGNDDLDNLRQKQKNIKWVRTCKFLRVLFYKQGNIQDEIAERISKGKKVTGSLNSIIWDNNNTIETIKGI